MPKILKVPATPDTVNALLDRGLISADQARAVGVMDRPVTHRAGVMPGQIDQAADELHDEFMTRIGRAIKRFIGSAFNTAEFKRTVRSTQQYFHAESGVLAAGSAFSDKKFDINLADDRYRLITGCGIIVAGASDAALKAAVVTQLLTATIEFKVGNKTAEYALAGFLLGAMPWVSDGNDTTFTAYAAAAEPMHKLVHPNGMRWHEANALFAMKPKAELDVTIKFNDAAPAAAVTDVEATLVLAGYDLFTDRDS